MKGLKIEATEYHVCIRASPETPLLPLFSTGSSQRPFLFSAISSVEIWKALKAIDLKK